MPSCRNCGARLSKFDKDICPVCGTKNPFEGVSSETIDITSQIDISGFAEGQKVVRHRKTAMLLSMLIGFTGAMFFYLKQKKNAILWLSINLCGLSSIFLLLFLVVGLQLVVSLIIPIALIILVNIGMGIYYYLKPNLKDGEGEFVV